MIFGIVSGHFSLQELQHPKYCYFNRSARRRQTLTNEVKQPRHENVREQDLVVLQMLRERGTKSWHKPDHSREKSCWRHAG